MRCTRRRAHGEYFAHRGARRSAAARHWQSSQHRTSTSRRDPAGPAPRCGGGPHWTRRTRNVEVLSPFDEQQHLDYAVKAGNFDLPGDDERLGQTAMRETACRGIDTAGHRPARLRHAGARPGVFPDYGYNTASNALPGYYFPTGLIARVIDALTPVSSPLLAIRLVGALWLGAGLAVMMVLASRSRGQHQVRRDRRQRSSSAHRSSPPPRRRRRRTRCCSSAVASCSSPPSGGVLVGSACGRQRLPRSS